jgi:hypothetical protein
MNFPINNRVLILASLIIGLFLGGITGFLLSPKPNYGEYVSTIIELENDILDLDITIANLQLELAQNKANISNYTIQISKLQLNILELKAKILEIEAQAISDWNYEQLQHAYFQIKSKYENLTELYNWVSNSYYVTQNDLNWVFIKSFNGTAEIGGKLNSTSEEFEIYDPDVKIVWEFRSDLYENFIMQLTDNDRFYGPIENYKIISTNDWDRLITYTRIQPGKNYHLELNGEYKKTVIDNINNGTLTLEEPDYQIKIYFGE